MIANSSGSCQAKAKNFKLSTIHIATQSIKKYQPQRRNGVANLKHRDWL
jgi:hypothetical protein